MYPLAIILGIGFYQNDKGMTSMPCHCQLWGWLFQAIIQYCKRYHIFSSLKCVPQVSRAPRIILIGLVLLRFQC